MQKEQRAQQHRNDDQSHQKKMYLRFVAMILTAMIAMYGLTYANTYAFDHVRWSEERAFMIFIMGGCMAIIMLGFMWGMFKNLQLNAAIVVGAIAMVGLGLFLVRTETTVQDRSYMSAMIPHHSIAILTSEHSELQDVRVCQLAVGIIDAQRLEIREMEWLIDDINENGPATTPAAADQRPVPDFQGGSIRSCPTE